MLSIAFAAAIALDVGSSDACDVIQEWRTDMVSCEVVSRPSVTLGGVTLDSPVFGLTEYQDSTEHGAGGYVHFDLNPLADSGYYVYGVRGACRDLDGNVTAASTTGMAAEMYPPAYYRTESRLADGQGFTVAYNDSPCLAPSERVAVLFLGYTADQPDTSTLGWSDGQSSVQVVGGYLSFAASYDESSQVATVSHTALGGNWSGDTSASSAASKIRSFFGTSDSVRGTIKCHAYDSSVLSSSSEYYSSSGLWYTGDGSYDIFGSWSTTCPQLTEYASFEFELPDAASVGGRDFLHYRSNAEPETAAYSARAFVVRDTELDAISYVPSERGSQPPDWLCTDVNCVAHLCDDYSALDVGGTLKCFFGFDSIDTDSLGDDLIDTLSGWGPYQTLEYGNGVVLSLGYAIGAKDGACGEWFTLPEILGGGTFDTCSLPSSDTVHTVGTYLLYLGALFYFVRLMLHFVQTGKILSYFGFGGSSS